MPPNVYACVTILIKVDGARLIRPLTQYKLRLASLWTRSSLRVKLLSWLRTPHNKLSRGWITTWPLMWPRSLREPANHTSTRCSTPSIKVIFSQQPATLVLAHKSLTVNSIFIKVYGSHWRHVLSTHIIIWTVLFVQSVYLVPDVGPISHTSVVVDFSSLAPTNNKPSLLPWYWNGRSLWHNMIQMSSLLTTKSSRKYIFSFIQ